MFSHGVRRFTTERLRSANKSGISLPYRRYYSDEPPSRRSTSILPSWIRPYLAIAGLTATGSLVYFYSDDIRKSQNPTPPPPPPPKLKIEEPKINKQHSKEENREALSSQHVQVKKSWEHPGVYAWGSNSGRVVNPDSNETFIKTPRRIPYFDGMLLRDLKLDRNFGVAITEKGDLIQWGKGYSETDFKPAITLKGKNLISLSITRDRIIGLSSSGNLYSLPVAKSDQESGPKPTESSWLPLWKSKSRLSYRLLQPRLGLGEKVTSISGGLEHILMLTDSGRVFSAACASDRFPSRGQLGVPGLTWTTRPPGPFDACHEIANLRGTKITNIAAGDYHSLVLDRDGRVFVFGDNASGQLGLPTYPGSDFTDTPVLLPLQSLYRSKDYQVKANRIAAGGANSFFAVDAKRVLGHDQDKSTVRELGRVTSDVWSCGNGLCGSLGNGKWAHVQDSLTKVKALSGLFEFSEAQQKVVSIGISNISVGSTHASAVLNNSTNVTSSKNTSQADTNWGSDVLWWGGNEFFQLGTGKRNNAPTPLYINPPGDIDVQEHEREEHRFQITPRRTVKVEGRNVNFEQRTECGRYATAVYSAV